MAYIYCITNKINGKQYIGKTEYENIQKRWKEHLRDCKKEKNKKRPLYNAMNKYGIQNFFIQEVEYVPPEINLEEREQYWIERFNTYSNGYNATLGGDGKHYLDYEMIIQIYKETQSCIKTANILQCHEDSVKKVLKKYNISILPTSQVNKINNSKQILMYDLNNNFLQSFDSANDAARYIKPEYQDKRPNGGVVSHITDVCKRRRKTAYGYIWRFAN